MKKANAPICRLCGKVIRCNHPGCREPVHVHKSCAAKQLKEKKR